MAFIYKKGVFIAKHRQMYNVQPLGRKKKWRQNWTQTQRGTQNEWNCPGRIFYFLRGLWIVLNPICNIMYGKSCNL